MTKDWRDPDITVAFHWDYKNSNEVSDEVLSLKERGVRIINERCTNIKKDYLDEKFTEIFGYSLLVNPTTHYGICTKVSTQQALHSSKLVQCPITPHQVESKVIRSATGETHRRLYRRFIDTRFELDKVRDIRIPIIGGTIPTLFIKELSVLSTFHPFKGNYFKVYTTQEYSKWLTGDELRKIIRLADAMGLDFGEFDALRDNSTGKLYVCDINDKAIGVLFNSLENKEETIDYLSRVVKEKLL